jgi:hypothetical protein
MSSSSESLSSLDDLCASLKKQLLIDLRLGWHDSLDIDFSKRRQVQRLVRALKLSSSVLHVRIGSKIRDRKVVSDILQALNDSGCRSIQTIELVLHPAVQWLPEEGLKSFFVKQTYLERIGLHGVQAVVVVRSPAGPARVPPPPMPSSSSLLRKYWSDRSVISRVIVHLHRHERLKTLELVDCNVTDLQANQLADFLHVRAGVRLARLSLRLNRNLTSEGLRVLCQAPVMEQMDLSLCDLNTLEAKAIAASIAKRPWPLRALILSGNRQIETSGWIALTSRDCCSKLTTINLSYCVVSCAQVVSILDSLERNLSPTAALQEINMQGCPHLHEDVGETGVSDSLCRLLRHSSSLRVVRLNDPRSSRHHMCSCFWSTNELSRLLEALKHNYEIEQLLYDSWRGKPVGLKSSAAASSIRNDMDFVLRLNQAGRRILLDRQGQQQGNRDRRPVLRKTKHSCLDDEWLEVLEKAGKDDLSILYWLVRESAHRFGNGSVTHAARKLSLSPVSE